MSTDAERQQAKLKEFMSILPLTIELAGLARSEPGKFFTDGQMEVRVTMLRTAFKQAKLLLREISAPAEGG